MNNSNKIIFTLGALVPMVLASCNSNNGIGKLNREVYDSCEYSLISERYNKIKASQFDNPEYRTGVKLKDNIKNGVITFKYKFIGKGTMRYFDLSLHKVDANVSAGYILSYDLDKQILKAEGEDETHYFKKGEDGKYYQFVDCVTDGEERHIKFDMTDKVLYRYGGDFDTFIADTIDYYSCLVVPLAFSVATGITGNYEVSIIPTNDYSLIPYQYTVDELFSEETHNFITSFNEKYKDQGYELKTTYGSKDEKSICTSINGKGKIEELHGKRENGLGDFTVDLFASYKDNFVNQFEIAFSGDRHEDAIYYTNYQIHYELYLLHDFKVGEYKGDTIDESKYELH